MVEEAIDGLARSYRGMGQPGRGGIDVEKGRKAPAADEYVNEGGEHRI